MVGRVEDEVLEETNPTVPTVPTVSPPFVAVVAVAAVPDDEENEAEPNAGSDLRAAPNEEEEAGSADLRPAAEEEEEEDFFESVFFLESLLVRFNVAVPSLLPWLLSLPPLLPPPLLLAPGRTVQRSGTCLPHTYMVFE